MTPRQLKRVKKKLGLSLTQMAAALTVNRRTLCRYLSGEMPIPGWAAVILNNLLKELKT